MAKLPHAPQAERAVLGAMLKGKIEECFDELDELDFYLPANRLIFLAARDVYAKGRRVDEVMIIEALNKQGELAQAGNITYITDLQRNMPALVNFRHYIDILKDQRRLREYIDVAEEIGKRAMSKCQISELNTSREVQEYAERAIYEIGLREQRQDFVSLGEAVADSYFQLGDIAKPGNRFTGIKTGFSKVDNILGGMKAGQLIIIAARPSMGKSALAANIGSNNAKDGKVVAFFSQEMSVFEVATRVLCEQGEVDLSRAMSGKTAGEEWAKLASAVHGMGEYPLFIDATAGISVAQIRSKLRKLRAKQKRLDLVIIDYLQLMTHKGRKNGSKNDDVAEVTRLLKIMAGELETPIILLSQLNRASEIADRKPRLSDLRDSGAIEQDADIVLFVDRKKEKPTELADILIAKNRNGPIMATKLMFQGEYCRFRTPHEGEE